MTNAFGTPDDTATNPDLSVFSDEGPPVSSEPGQPEVLPGTEVVDSGEGSEPGAVAPPAELPTGGTEATVAEGAPPPVTYAGRFESVEALEAGYRQLQGHQTRTYQESRALQDRNAQLEEAIRQALPLIQQQQAQGGVGVQGSPTPALNFDDPDTLPGQIDQLIAHRVAEETAKLQQQFTAQQAQTSQQAQQAQWQQSAQRNIEIFRGKHPEIVPGTEADMALEQIARTYRIDAADVEQLELAYDIWKNPLVGRNLAANPGWVASPEGREMARTWGVQPAPAPVVGQPGATGTVARTRPVAHVETGGTGAPVQAAPGERPAKGDFEDVMAAWDQAVANASPFYRR